MLPGMHMAAVKLRQLQGPVEQAHCVGIRTISGGERTWAWPCGAGRPGSSVAPRLGQATSR